VAAALCRRDRCAGGTAAVAFATENEIIKKLLRGYKLKRGLSASRDLCACEMVLSYAAAAARPRPSRVVVVVVIINLSIIYDPFF